MRGPVGVDAADRLARRSRSSPPPRRVLRWRWRAGCCCRPARRRAPGRPWSSRSPAPRPTRSRDRDGSERRHDVPAAVRRWTTVRTVRTGADACDDTRVAVGKGEARMADSLPPPAPRALGDSGKDTGEGVRDRIAAGGEGGHRMRMPMASQRPAALPCERHCQAGRAARPRRPECCSPTPAAAQRAGRRSPVSAPATGSACNTSTERSSSTGPGPKPCAVRRMCSATAFAPSPVHSRSTADRPSSVIQLPLTAAALGDTVGHAQQRLSGREAEGAGFEVGAVVDTEQHLRIAPPRDHRAIGQEAQGQRMAGAGDRAAGAGGAEAELQLPVQHAQEAGAGAFAADRHGLCALLRHGGVQPPSTDSTPWPSRASRLHQVTGEAGDRHRLRVLALHVPEQEAPAAVPIGNRS